MARKTETVVIKADGRDQGKHFLLTEMPATRAEKWATRALLALSRSHVQIPEEMTGLGMHGLVALGINILSSLDYVDAEPLMDEMMQCIEIIPDPRHVEVRRPLIEDDTEEVGTVLLLRSEVIKLHTGFSIADALSNARASAAQTSANTSATPTSPPA